MAKTKRIATIEENDNINNSESIIESNLSNKPREYKASKKSYYIHFEDELDAKHVINLSLYCRENNINYAKLYATLKTEEFYDGMRLARNYQFVPSNKTNVIDFED